MLADHIIEQGSLRRRGERLSVDIRLPWYRALPLSSITDVGLEADGVAAPTDSLTLTVNEHTYRLDELPPRFDEMWYVLDSARLEGTIPSNAAQDDLEIRVEIGVYIPYIPAGPGFIKLTEQDLKRLTVDEGDLA